MMTYHTIWNQVIYGTSKLSWFPMYLLFQVSLFKQAQRQDQRAKLIQETDEFGLNLCFPLDFSSNTRLICISSDKKGNSFQPFSRLVFWADQKTPFWVENASRKDLQFALLHCNESKRAQHEAQYENTFCTSTSRHTCSQRIPTKFNAPWHPFTIKLF